MSVLNDVFYDCDIPPLSLSPSTPPPPFLPFPYLLPSPIPSLSHRNCPSKGQNLKAKQDEIKINCYDVFQILILSLGMFTLLRLFLLHICTHENYVAFNTDLTLCTKKKPLFFTKKCISTYLSLLVLGLLLLSECDKEQIVVFIVRINPNIDNAIDLSLKFSKIISRVFCGTLLLYKFCISITPATCTLCLIIFQIWCHWYVRRVLRWLPIILIILSNDVHLNPGPHFQNNFFNFMLWKVNSLAKDNFQRVRLIEANNSIFNYDLVSICETSLNDSVELLHTLLNDYTFVPANNPANSRNGGVGLFYKNSLPVIVRTDLSFDESIVVELKFGRKKIFFTVLYRTPSFNHTIYSKLKTGNPFAIFKKVILMCTPSFGGLVAIQLLEVQNIEDLFTKRGLSQFISEPTNFEPHRNLSCIDLVVTDQPNIILVLI